ncbi:hypothetical protein GCM10012283_09920 [Phycicoccus endophyticus]|nr:hypothetical protein GCM10012283_09920 [Phycicoccus endophyticus]
MPSVAPSPADLDDLVLLRRGLYGPDARMRPLHLSGDLAARALTAGALQVVDPEGVPVARVEQLRDAGEGRVEGEPQWLSWPSERPFERLLLEGPVDLSGEDVRLVESPADVPEAPADGSHILVIASTSLDGPSAGTDTVRAAVAAAASGASVHVVPLPPGDAERREALLRTLGLDPTDLPASGGTAAASPPRGAGVVVLLTGLSGSGKSTVARAAAIRLVEEGSPLTLLDGDIVRRHLTAGLGFSPADRRTNVLRIGWVAAEVAHHGGIAVCSPIAPEDTVRRQVAALVAERGGRFLLVHVATPLEECERRDRKGLYAAARRGEIPDFTGISAPYDVPGAPDLRLDTTGRSVQECADEVLALVHSVRENLDA